MIAIPQKPEYISLGENHGKFEILGCYPGYGTTLGNALRRVLLSSLEGAAIRSVKITGVTHEFTTVPGVMEDVVQILLHLKQIRFRLHGDEPVKLSLKVKGERVVTAKDFKVPSSVEIVDGDQMIATITDKKTELEMEIEIDRGVGYVSVEARDREEREIGVIAVDSIYSPVKRVNYEVENMRVGKRTDYDKITLEILTDGSIAPEEAFAKSVAILMNQFTALSESRVDEEAEVIEAVSVAEVAPVVVVEAAAKEEKKSKKKAE
ncbi:MAG: DNA-directed RNA polymerase subunit alpha [Candidatus Moranbacteria bacterium]|jgi:DNA-directed RNA polymerase subunit alpha|nr:DNA-directed RNA polymerase subunit alpha [Candidatus Moranbacteria bacterium]MBP9801437.1 DNA-directed RNA polymerase subunit alpha [Candidatus Moranbacteria bacterium]